MASTVLIALCLYSGFADIVAAETTNDNPLPSFDQWFNPGEIDGIELKSNATTDIYAMLSNEKMVAPDRTWELSHPGLVIYDNSQKVITSTSRLENSQFVANNRINATFSVARQPTINKLNVSETSANTSSTDGTAGAAALSPVYIYSVSYNWYWVQDTWFNNEVTIYNAGPAIVSGKVVFISQEDGYGYYAPYTNLAPYTFATVTVPFEVIGSLSTVGIKPIIVQVRVDPNDEVTDAMEMPVDGIEKYNNDASHLADPDGGDSLESSELYHPLSDGYTILQEAATACDNTISPYTTAFIGNVYVKYIFNYSNVSPLEQYTAADLYIKNHMLNGKY